MNLNLSLPVILLLVPTVGAIILAGLAGLFHREPWSVWLRGSAVSSLAFATVMASIIILHHP